MKNLMNLSLASMLALTLALGTTSLLASDDKKPAPKQDDKKHADKKHDDHKKDDKKKKDH